MLIRLRRREWLFWRLERTSWRVPFLPLVLLATLLLCGQVTEARSPTDSFADLVERLAPAVVNIATSTRPHPPNDDEGDSPFEDLPPGTPYQEFFDFFNKRGQNQQFQPTTSLGSGFIIDPDGYVVTNNHVIADADQVTVVLADNTRLNAVIVGRDPKIDIALLKVENGAPLPFVEFGDSDGARVGDWVIAIGNPFGLGNTVTAGILSARGRDINAGPYDDFLQTDAPINRGNSGGPMFDMNGQVIGVNTLIYSPSGGSVGIGFATPATIVRPVVEQLRQHGRTIRGWLGVRIQSVSDEIADSLGLEKASGALVAAVIEDGPAQAADIRQGDVILSFDGRTVDDRRALPRIVADTLVGKEVPVVLWRDGKEMTTSVVIGRLEDYELASANTRRSPAKPERTEQSFSALGLTLAIITPERREAFELGDDVAGLLVTGVDGSVDADIKPGDIIVELGNDEISELADVQAQLDTLADADSKLVVVLRERAGDRAFVALELLGG